MKHRKLTLLLACLGTLIGIAISTGSSPTPVSEVAHAQTTSPEAAEYFQLSFPLSTKPARADVVIYTSMVDHTPGFYCAGSNNYTLQPYTGETVSLGCRCGTECGGATTRGRSYWYNGHSGLDIGVTYNTPIYAAHAGSVVAFGDASDGYGTKILLRDLENPQFLTLYGHLSSAAVSSTGQEVLRGQRIGYSGDTGSSGAPHLHFGFYYNIRNEDTPYVLDPYGWFSLLPDNLGAQYRDYRWASGVPADGNMGEPHNWNRGAVIGNEYISKARGRNGPKAIGIPNSPGVDAIERFWANSQGSPGAPVTAASGNCQEFEGGTYCSGGYTGRFQDVPWDFWAHRYVGWANREGVVGGYPCGGTNPNTGQAEPCVGPYNLPYFRPKTLVTRAQFAKIMVEGFSLPINTTGGPHFYDVPTNAWSYNYVETMYNTWGDGERLMSGNSCMYGTCFYPQSNITRGQVSKVVELLAENKGWFCNHHQNGGPDFWDVPTNHTFYKYIEKLYNAGAVQYRQEDSSAGAGGHYFVAWESTRAQVTMFLHELLHSVSPPPPNVCRQP
jgi:murein DD-endopeptidase MepM/ murein hydrolase activator NlpD